MDTEGSNSLPDHPEVGNGSVENNQNNSESQATPQTTPVAKQENPFVDEKSKWAEDIRKILEEHRLYYDQDIFVARLDGNARYFALNVGEFDPTGENNRMIIQERFFKAPFPKADEAEKSKFKRMFTRQIKVQEYLSQQGKFPVAEVLDSNLDENQGPLYAVMSWYQSGDNVGFLRAIEDNKLLKPEHAKLAVQAIKGLHHLDGELPEEVRGILDRQAPYQDLIGFKANLARILSRKVTSVGEDFSEEGYTFAHLMAKKLDVPDFVQKVDAFIEQFRPLVESYQDKGTHLVHGDFSPSNVFLGDGLSSTRFMGLDFEWTGVTQNEILAAVFDFGNMRSRAWNNPEFQAALDREVIAAYGAEGREDVGRAVVALGILRSQINHLSFFENVPGNHEEPESKERREVTEENIPQAWEFVGQSLTT